MVSKHFVPKTVSLILLFASLSLHAAVLDNLVEKIETHFPAKKKHSGKYHRRIHRYHAISQEAQWQTALQYLGYYKGKINGDILTPSFFDAVIAFHKDHGEIDTGFLEDTDKRYLTKVYRTLSLNKYLSYTGKNKFKQAQKLQAALYVTSFYHGNIDGYFKKRSKRAFRHYSAQYADTNMTKEEIKQRLLRDAQTKLEQETEKIKQETYNPADYEEGEGETPSML